MTRPIVEVHGLSKRYQLGRAEEKYQTLREAINRVALAPFRSLRAKPVADASRAFWALRDVSFTVRQGEVLGIIGRNGAGKSTLLKLLSRITEPTSGWAELHGRVGSLLEVGTGFHPELTGRENMQLSGAILGMRRAEIERKFDDIVAFAGVEKFIDTPVKHYSSGMYLRLAFAVAAHLEPEILIVDEVLAVGDAEFQRKCLGKMGEVAKGGRTVFFTSHNMGAIERFCSRVLLLHEGQVVADGPPAEVVRQYLGSGLVQAGERVWTPDRAPGDDVVRMTAVRAFAADGKIVSEVSVRDPVEIEVEFIVKQPGNHLNVALFLHNEAGDIIFVTGDWNALEWEGKPRPCGAHKVRCAIPGDLLNEGNIIIQVGISTLPFISRAIDPHAITLRVSDPLTPGGARGYLTRPWPGGAIRPQLQWSSSFVERAP